MAAKKRSRGSRTSNHHHHHHTGQTPINNNPNTTTTKKHNNNNGSFQTHHPQPTTKSAAPPPNNGSSSSSSSSVVQSPIDPKEAARLIKTAAIDPSTQIVRHLAIFRLIIFLLLVYTYVKYLPHSELNQHVDSWLTYDQFEVFYSMAPKLGGTGASFLSIAFLACAVFFGMPSALGGINGVAHSYQVSGWIFLSCFFVKFFTFAPSFSDRHYLLFLLGVVAVISGGGSFFLVFTEVDPQMTPAQQQTQRMKRQRLIQDSEWAAITLRLQYAVVFLFSSFWKLHADSFQGHILRSHLIDQHDQQTGLPTWFWRILDAYFGSVGFQLVGMVTFLMDLGMFLVLTFRRPTDETSRSFVLYSTLFHTMVALSIGHKLGYSFSITCFVGTLIFHPIGGGSKAITTENQHVISSTDQTTAIIKKRIRNRKVSAEANLIQWVIRYATGSPDARATRQQQIFTLVWLFVQIILPLRMPFISGGSYPFTARGYRFSWTMLLHSRQTTINHVGKYSTPSSPTSPVAEKMVPLHLFYVVPECSSKTLQRKDYMPERAVATEDPRTLPINSVLTEQQKAFVKSYPRYGARVAGGLSMLLNRQLPEACGNSTHVAAFAVHFAKLNGRGAYHRIFDPTVDMTLVEMDRLTKPIWGTIWGVMFDKAPTKREYMLSTGIGSIDRYIYKHRRSVGIAALGAQRVEHVADRTACLSLRPLALWTNGFPVAFMALELPRNAELLVTSRSHGEAASANLTITAGNQWDILDPPRTDVLKLGVVHQVTAVSLEVSARFTDNFHPGSQDCADSSTEDVLFALFFMS